MATTNFKKFERTGVVLRAAGTALVDVTLDVGNVNETVTVSADALNNITLESQAIARGLDEQQLHDLPRNSRDIQSFLLLNPNVVGSSGDIQFLGGRTYGVCVHPGRSGVDERHLRNDRQLRSRPRCGVGDYGVVELLQRRYRGLAGVVVTTKRGASNFRGTSFYDFNNSGLNALTYNQKLSGVQRGDPNAETHDTGGVEASAAL